MGSDVNTKRMSTFVVLIALLVLMSVTCVFAVMQANAPSGPASSTSVPAEFTKSVERSATPSTEGVQASHECGVPQSPPSVASSPLLDPLTVLPLLDVLELPQVAPSARSTHEDLPLRQGDGLLTFLCVQRV
ncbi:hypothetical protein [Nocardiopsis oceani]